MGKRYTVDLVQRAALDRDLTGGKGSGCARLMHYGFSVPHGFVVTIKAFREFISQVDRGNDDALADSQAVRFRTIRESIMAASFPDALRRAVIKSYRRLGGRVAVRSSMKAEDSVLASYAGQLESILNVEGEAAVLDCVKKIFASLYSERLVHYRVGQKTRVASETGTLEIAVLVQRMIDAEISGIAFTADPNSGQRCVIIECASGYGDSIVNGRVDTDRYVVDARGGLSEQRLVHGVSALSQDLVLKLAEQTNRIASRMRRPQDIEWVWNGSEFYFLQSRPITTLLDKTVYSRRLVSDMSPGLIKPLVWSTNTLGMMRNVFGRLFKHLIGVTDIDLESCVRRISSRLYADMTAFGELLERIGLPANFFEVVTLHEKHARQRTPLNWRLVRTCLRCMPFVLRHGRYKVAIERYIMRHYQQYRSLRQVEWSTREKAKVVSAAEKIVLMHGRSQWYMWVTTMNMMVRNRLLGVITKKICPDVVSSNMLRGLDGLKALTPNDKIEELAEQAARLDPKVQALFLRGDQRQIKDELAQTKEGRAFLQRVVDFLSEFGFLSANGTDFTLAPWIENPMLVWRALGRLISTHARREPLQIVEIRERERARVRAKINPIARRLFDAFLGSTLSYIDLREKMSIIMSEDAYQMRRVFLVLGEHLVRLGVIGKSDDIFFLYFDEVKALIHQEISSFGIQDKISRRKKKMQLDAVIEPAENVIGDTITDHAIEASTLQEFLTGISGSPGLVSGRARIINDPSLAPGDLDRSDILVVPFTDIGWTPLFMGIGGIVAETGGQLSHTSIVAREYGLPAVVGIKNATRVIREGQCITIDGNDGRVYFRTKERGGV
jgi:phosphohistidine swiveling domain-containing protein